jgi:hypothetical protein
MSHARSTCAFVVTLVVAACAGEPPTAPTAVAADHADAPQDLRLVVPSLDEGQLVANGSDDTPAAGGPEEVTPPGDDIPSLRGSSSDVDITPYLNEMGAIYDARTKVGFGPGYGYSFGSHSYQGNKGRVETTVNVWLDGFPMGSQAAVTEKYTMFLTDFGLVKYISATAHFYTDKDCGLSVTGKSEHSAWWEWFLGGSSTHWGDVTQTSDAAPVAQPECQPDPDPPYVGTSSSDTTCYYWVTYDLETGEVIDAELLGCNVGG